MLQAVDLPVPLGAHCEILRENRTCVPAQAIGFQGAQTLLSPLVSPEGISPGNRVHFRAAGFSVAVGESLLGCLLDASGSPLDGCRSLSLRTRVPLHADPPSAVSRAPVNSIMTTGIRAIDALLTIGHGQRIAISAEPLVETSRLLGMLARGSDADVIVAGLIGVRGCQPREFLGHELDTASREKCVTIVATGDQPALARILAAHTSTAIAEYFRDQGKRVLLMLNSISHWTRACGELDFDRISHDYSRGGGAGSRANPEMSQLSRLVERAGPAAEGNHAANGSITGVYLISTDAHTPHPADGQSPAFDGHIHLSRAMSDAEIFPPIDLQQSYNGLQRQLQDESQLQHTRRVRQMIAKHSCLTPLSTHDLDAHQGKQPVADFASLKANELRRFLSQDYREYVEWSETRAALRSLAS
jgi:FliI/YscN family ATPase